jgi:hypothetical protein
LGLDGPHGLADGGTAHVEAARQLAFGGEEVTDPEGAVEDLPLHPVQDDLVGAQGGPRRDRRHRTLPMT